MATEYTFYSAGRIDSAGRRDEPVRVGLRLGVGVNRKVVDIELTDKEALSAASNLITAVLFKQRQAARTTEDRE